MIRLVKRKNLNIEKYNACIENSEQSRIYAFSWYLDTVSNNWDALVLGDYIAVMPIPWHSKFGLKFIIQPDLCQQLGVFSTSKISENTVLEFISKFPKLFLKISYQFNSCNLFSHKRTLERVNYVLALKQDYLRLNKRFSKGRKSAIKVAEKLGLTIDSVPISSIFKITKKYYTKFKIDKKQYFELEKLYNLKHCNSKVLGVFNGRNILLGGAFFIKHKNRITYLYSSFSEEGRKKQASSFLMSYIIKKHSNKDFLLDFEGSNIPSIASFYKSFGAKKEKYLAFNNNFLVKAKKSIFSSF